MYPKDKSGRGPDSIYSVQDFSESLTGEHNNQCFISGERNIKRELSNGGRSHGPDTPTPMEKKKRAFS